MKEIDFRIWKQKQYHKRSWYFWLSVAGINTFAGFITDQHDGAIVGLVLAIVYFFGYGMFVGSHPENLDEENWHVSSDKMR